MASSQYKRPPITEAVIEIRLEEPLSRKVVDKIHNRLRQAYESTEQISTVQFVFDQEKKDFSRTPEAFEGYRLTSKDQADIIQIKSNAMVCSRLAPYSGWENFEPRARKNWETWTKTIKNIKIKRIGVRYLNRIDIPFGKNGRIDIENYLNVFPKYPEPHLLRAFTHYTMQIVGPFSTKDFNLIINTNVVASPLIDRFSIVLDLDLSPKGEIPQRNDKIWQMINQMREYKNNAFEMCITDMARELFV